MNLRKLDALVAEHIMDLGPTEEKVWRGRKDYYLKSDTAFVAVPMYTRTIGAAWDVVEKVDGLWTIDGQHHIGWTASLVESSMREARYQNPFTASAETAPIAICLCALKSKGIDVSEWEG